MKKTISLLIVILTFKIASSHRFARIRSLNAAPFNDDIFGKSQTADFSELTKAATQASGNGKTSISSSISTQGTSTQVQATNGGSQASSFAQKLNNKQESQELKQDGKGNTSVSEKKSNEGHQVEASNKSLFKGNGASNADINLNGVQADVYGSKGAALSNTFNKQEIKQSSSQQLIQKQQPQSNIRNVVPPPRPLPTPIPKPLPRPIPKQVPRPIPSPQPNSHSNAQKKSCGNQQQAHNQNQQNNSDYYSNTSNHQNRAGNKNLNHSQDDFYQGNGNASRSGNSQNNSYQRNGNSVYTGTVTNVNKTVQKVSQNPPYIAPPTRKPVVTVGSYYEE